MAIFNACEIELIRCRLPFYQRLLPRAWLLFVGRCWSGFRAGVRHASNSNPCLAVTPEGAGIAFSAARFVCDKVLPFLRVGYSDSDAALMPTTLGTGTGVRRENNDVAVVNNRSFGYRNRCAAHAMYPLLVASAGYLQAQG